MERRRSAIVASDADDKWTTHQVDMMIDARPRTTRRRRRALASPMAAPYALTSMEGGLRARRGWKRRCVRAGAAGAIFWEVAI